MQGRAAALCVWGCAVYAWWFGQKEVRWAHMCLLKWHLLPAGQASPIFGSVKAALSVVTCDSTGRSRQGSGQLIYPDLALSLTLALASTSTLSDI